MTISVIAKSGLAIRHQLQKPNTATNSELADDDVIMRYEGNDIIGLTVLHASRR